MTHTLGVSLQSPSGQISANYTATGDSNLELNLTIAPAASKAETDMVLVATSGSSGVQSIFLLATAAMVVHGNSVAGGWLTGNDKNVITLAANTPYEWITGQGTSPITASWAAIYVDSTPGGTLQIRVLQGQ
jgi:hypothetical protein